MTRPPFAEFSALAIRELTAWIGGNALWSGRLNDLLGEHFLPVAGEAGLDPEEAWEALGEFTGPVYGAGLEDLCTRRYEDPPQNLVGDFLKKRGFRLPLSKKTNRPEKSRLIVSRSSRVRWIATWSTPLCQTHRR